MSLYLYTSNKTEVLADQFIEKVYRNRNCSDLFKQETVVVQTQGMASWLKLYIAEKTRIAINVSTPFLNSFADSVLHKYLPENDLKLLTRDWAFWKLFHIFFCTPEKYPELQHYIHDTENRELKCAQLAEKTAHLFDQYQIYHQDLLASWRMQQGETAQHWQARLYREILEGSIGRDQQFLEFDQLQLTLEQIRTLPEKVSIFGISSLAPLYFNFFRTLSRYTDVYFFHLNPSSDYWIDNMTRKEAEKTALKTHENPDILAEGNPLLTSCGSLSRDFMEYLVGEGVTGEECFSDHDTDTALHTVQQDILENHHTTGLTLPQRDKTIQIHSCHSKMRQTEVLHDELLKLLEDPALEPRDILVMTPDIAVFEPFIQGVFGTGPLQNHYSFSDKSLQNQNTNAETLFKVLELTESRYEVTAIFDLLDNRSIAEKWNLSELDTAELRKWAEMLRIHWGIDADMHEKFSSARFSEFSWRPALDRMVLGYAVAEKGLTQADDPTIPFDAAEGSAAVMMGNFIDFAETLFELHGKFRHPKVLQQWCSELDELVGLLFKNTKNNFQELAELRQSFQEIRDMAELSAMHNVPLSLNTVIWLLKKYVDSTQNSAPFLRGKITFCSLVPMRSIPMKVIAVLGLEEQDFPRRDIADGFNLIPPEKQRKALVRSRNKEDRNLFLEILLAARKNLLFFYTGRNNKSNKQMLPSTPLSELKDILAETFPGAAFEAEHKLQAFDPDYFRKDSSLNSYSISDYKACLAFNQFKNDSIAGKNELPAEYPRYKNLERIEKKQEFYQISPDKLFEFFRNPSRAFLAHITGYRKSFDSTVVFSDEEEMHLEKWETNLIQQELIDKQDPVIQQKYFQYLQKTNHLPVGDFGITTYNDLLQKIKNFPEKQFFTFEEWNACLKAQQLEWIQFKCGDFEINGKIPVCSLNGCHFRNFTTKNIEKPLLALRINQVLLACAGKPANAFYWNLNKQEIRIISSPNQEEAMLSLQDWLELYKQGHEMPLPFFPKTSAAAATTQCYLPDTLEELILAKKEYEEDPTIRNCYTDIFKKTNTAAEVFKPTSYSQSQSESADEFFSKFFTEEDFGNPAFIFDFIKTAQTIFDFMYNGQMDNTIYEQILSKGIDLHIFMEKKQ